MNKLVYIVNVHEYDGENEPIELSNKDFAIEARKQDNVLSLRSFEVSFNDCEISAKDCYIRIMDEGAEHKE